MEPEKTVSKYMTEYRLNGQLHREDGPAVTWKDGNKEWYLHGKQHREDGPALIWNDGTEEWWYLHGQFHREDGPAIISKEGSEWWYLNGTELTKEDTETAKQILSGEYALDRLPLLINHDVLKYFALSRLGRGA